MIKLPLHKSDKVTLIDDDDYEKCKELKLYLNCRGYAQFYIGQKPVLLHRHVFGKDQDIDHVNGDALDNRKCNLRYTTISQNGMNRRKQKKPTSSKYKGVHYSKNAKKWHAYLQWRRVPINIGYFVSEDDAARAYNKRALEMFGEFARLNIIETK
jgi:hypothetical protein